MARSDLLAEIRIGTPSPQVDCKVARKFRIGETAVLHTFSAEESAISQKTETDQQREAVLTRMLRKPPQLKDTSKTVKSGENKSPSSEHGSKSLPGLRESVAETRGKSSSRSPAS